MSCTAVSKAATGRNVPGNTVPVSLELLEKYVECFQAPDADELGLFDNPSPDRRG